MLRLAVWCLWFLTALLVLLAAVGVPVSSAGTASEGPEGPAAGPSSPAAILERLTDVGSALRLGFGVTPLGSSLPAVIGPPGAHGGESGRDLDLDSRGTAFSFDLTLAWPGAAKTALRPYVAFGPALFVIEPDQAGRLLGIRVDPTMQLGAKAGAGVNWRVGKHTTLFGAYEVMATPQGGGFVPSGAKTGADLGVTGYDFTYGLRFAY